MTSFGRAEEPPACEAGGGTLSRARGTFFAACAIWRRELSSSSAGRRPGGHGVLGRAAHPLYLGARAEQALSCPRRAAPRAPARPPSSEPAAPHLDHTISSSDARRLHLIRWAGTSRNSCRSSCTTPAPSKRRSNSRRRSASRSARAGSSASHRALLGAGVDRVPRPDPSQRDGARHDARRRC